MSLRYYAYLISIDKEVCYPLKEEGEYIIIEQPFKKGASIRLKGEEIKAGDILLKAGTRIRGYEVGLLAFANKVFVEVYHKFRGLKTKGHWNIHVNIFHFLYFGNHRPGKHGNTLWPYNVGKEILNL